jgi:putative ABC transport system ATP-binding protein
VSANTVEAPLSETAERRAVTGVIGAKPDPKWVIVTRGIKREYDMGGEVVRALRGVDVAIARNEYVAIMGPSGSGKSTLMHILGCLDRPTSGTYVLDGKDVSRMSKDELALIRNRKIGFVFQGFNLLSRTTALDNVELPMLYNGAEKLKTAERHKRAMEALKAVGLGERFHHFPNQLSGGQQQRVAIARALVTRPTILLADEPTGNLDTANSERAFELLQTIVQQGGKALLLATHNPVIAEACDWIHEMTDGRITASHPRGTRSSIF